MSRPRKSGRSAAELFRRRESRVRRSTDATAAGRDLLLNRALEIAKKRFGDFDGVCGIGLGRKFHESTGAYGVAPELTDGLCVKVMVAEKRADVPRSQRIPRWIVVRRSGTSPGGRVLVDVVTVGRPRRQKPSAMRQQSGRGWPTAGFVGPGRIFVFGRKPASETAQPFPSSANVEVGTVGAALRTKDDRYFVTSAAHVFCSPCSGNLGPPNGRFPLGAQGRSWIAIADSDFAPAHVSIGDRVYDAMLFEVPRAFIPSFADSWPDGFLEELASPEDIRAALRSDKTNGFVWVERIGYSRPVRIPVDLHVELEDWKTMVACGNGVASMHYGPSYALRFTGSGAKTIGGDSGAAVYIESADRTGYRLLGFHYLLSKDASYCLDARRFFADVLGVTVGDSVVFD